MKKYAESVTYDLFGSFEEEMWYICIIKNPFLINFFTVKVSGYDAIHIAN
jgi:hypothetical protein